MDMTGKNKNDALAWLVAILENGCVVVGSKLYAMDGVDICNAHVFQHNETLDDWTPIGNIIQMLNVQDGSWVYISQNGTIVAISTLASSKNLIGVIWVYKFNETLQDWVQKGLNILAEKETGGFGYKLNLSADGNILSTGAPQFLIVDGRQSSVGWVQVFITMNLWTNGASGAAEYMGKFWLMMGHVLVYQYDKVSDTWQQMGQVLLGN